MWSVISTMVMMVMGLLLPVLSSATSPVVTTVPIEFTFPIENERVANDADIVVHIECNPSPPQPSAYPTFALRVSCLLSTPLSYHHFHNVTASQTDGCVAEWVIDSAFMAECSANSMRMRVIGYDPSTDRTVTDEFITVSVEDN